MGRIKGSKNKPKLVYGEFEAAEAQAYKEDNAICLPPSSKKMIEGWINIYKHKGEYCTNYFSGSDIHATKESAVANAQRGVLGQSFISVEDK